MNSSIALTGATSFTGYWIARELSRHGWTVHALCSRSESSYAGLPFERLAALRSERVRLHFGLRGESPGLLKWIEVHRPAIWVQHHFFMEGFRSPDYDVARAQKESIDPLSGMVCALSDAGCQGILYSGSYFEPGEGGSAAEQVGRTPYAKMKAKAWKVLQESCQSAGLKVSKVVIPNPIGPMENEDRLIPLILKKASALEPLLLNSPHSISDNIPVGTLAQVYRGVAEKLLCGEASIARPSAWVCDTQEFVQTVSAELLQKRLGKPAIEVQLGNDPNPRSFKNSEPCSYRLDALWDEYADQLAKRTPLT